MFALHAARRANNVALSRCPPPEEKGRSPQPHPPTLRRGEQDGDDSDGDDGDDDDSDDVEERLAIERAVYDGEARSAISRAVC